MDTDEIVQQLWQLVANWRNEALASVPPEYFERGLEYKYLKMDNQAAGMDDCADDLQALIRKIAAQSVSK